ncbi:MAG TPA: redoxin family protein [Pyrinomonadaceae bacterium]
MNSLAKKIELIANVAIVVVALLLGAVLVKRYLLPQPVNPGPAASARIQPGTKLSLPGVDWGRSNKTLLLALSTTCHFCTESAPFYQRLARAAEAKGVKVIAVLPQPESEARQYLSELAIPVSEVRQSPLDSLGVSGTPTLILVDDKGQVASSWVGKLQSDRESEVAAAL